MAPKKNTTSSLSNKYQKLDPREHVLKRPNLYIGSIQEDVFKTWVFDDVMVKRDVKYNAGLLKIFDEILVNAMDHSVRLTEMKAKDESINLMKNIKVNISHETGVISVFNDGNGLDVALHPEHNIYIPELIFGNLMTSTNYDDDVEKVIGGTNGLGSKCTSIFSEWFQVETVDSHRKLLYKQKFEQNMTVKGEPQVTKFTKKPYTIITFKPDYSKFGYDKLPDDTFQLMKKRVYDACANTEDSVSVYLNDEKLDYKNFEKYTDAYLGDKKECPRVYEKINDRWEIIAAPNDNFDCISFVNGIWTLRGGKHVEYILNQIVKKLAEMIVKKNKNAIIKPNIIKDNLILFVKATIVNPTFDNQSKETLTTPISKFGSKAEVSDKFIEKLYKTGIVEKILASSQVNEVKTLQKTDGKKKSIIRGIPKLEDANWAGTSRSKECILTLCEGDSAMSMVISGLSEVGRDRFGCFPLKGKLMNVKDQTTQKIADNEEISNLKKILGLESGKEYKDVDDLRYGKIMILTDQDSVTFDTPCLVKNIETGLIDCKPICELYDDEWIVNPISNKEYSTCTKYLVWSDQGWTKIKSVMRHATNKPIHRVLTHTGCVDVTEDHSLLSKNGQEITVKDCIIKQTELLHAKYICRNQAPSTITTEYAYALGYFMADGSCTIDNSIKLRARNKVYETHNSVWSVDCVEKEPLIKLKAIFEKYECIEENNEQVHQNPESKYRCTKCNKYFPDNYSLHRHEERKSDCSIIKKLSFEIIKIPFGKDAYSKREFKYKLQAKGVRKQISYKYRAMFYNSLREKKVPSEILNAPINIQQSFIDGFYAGDGNKGEKHTTDCFDGEGKTQLMGLFHILQNCGYHPSINCSPKKTNVYTILMGRERGYYRPEYTIKKIFNVSDQYQGKYVYDFETENHHFHGSIGNLIVHNCDGTHVRSLLFNMFHSMWPSLVKCNHFLTSMLTPIVKVSKNKRVEQFYGLTDFDNWMKKNDNGKGWDIKYYKGLGTSTAAEAKQYFKDMKTITYIYNEKISDERLDLAFNKKKADERKEWLGGYDKQNILDYTCKEVTYEDFIDKELIHFSNYDVERSIPNMCDGFKISQRKILFSCFKKNLTKEIKVAQLAGYVSENSAYHHGEASLQMAIVGMAQDFVGSNNINLLQPLGQMGTRRCGGKDAAQPRYIFTNLSDICSKIFIKEDLDVLTYINDDGMNVEPEHYIPIIPMILVNGSVGIGTGFSTNIPCYNPRDIIAVLKRLINNEDVCGTETELVPWYNGFTGKIEKINNKYYSRGIFRKLAGNKVEITELPIGTWTFDFKCLLEDLLDKKGDVFKGYENNSTEDQVKFTIQFSNANVLEDYMAMGEDGITKFETELKLSTSKPLSTTNMYAFNHKGVITKFDTPLDIIKAFYHIRLDYYQKRKDYQIQKYNYDLQLLENKLRFVKAVVAEEIIPHKMRKSELEDKLTQDGYMLHEDSFDYIIRIPVYNLTIDKVAELEKEKNKALDKYNEILNKDIRDIWVSELDTLLNSLIDNQPLKKKLVKKN